MSRDSFTAACSLCSDVVSVAYDLNDPPDPDQFEVRSLFEVLLLCLESVTSPEGLKELLSVELGCCSFSIVARRSSSSTLKLAFYFSSPTVHH